MIQAGRLAVIGQMSISITHELNQLLVTLRTLSGSTVRFLQRGKLETASTSLTIINELADCTGRIAISLCTFARRSNDTGQASLAKVVDAALLALHGRLEQGPPTLHRYLDDVRLGIGQTRLKQTLVNLLTNALDVMSGRADRQLWLEGRCEEERYVLRMRDNGPGIPPATCAHLFKPFFITKPDKHGLGLNLTLSANLATAAGGSLSVQYPESGGTAFKLSLPLVPDSPTASSTR